MNIETFGFKVNDTKDLAFSLLSSRSDTLEGYAVKDEEFKKILSKFINNDKLEKGNLDANHEEMVVDGSNRIMEEKRLDDKDYSSELLLEDVVRILSLIKNHLKENKLFDKTLEDINKIIDLLKSSKVGDETVKFISNLLKDVKNLQKKGLMDESLKKLLSDAVLEISDLLKNLDRGLVQEGFRSVNTKGEFKLENDKSNDKSVEREFTPLIKEKVNSNTSYEKYENISGRIKVFDFRRTSESLGESIKYPERLVDFKFSKISVDSGNAVSGNFNFVFRVEDFKGEASELLVNQKVVKTRNLSDKNVNNTLLKYQDHFVKKGVFDEVSTVGKKLEFVSLNYTPVDFSRKSEVEGFNNSRLTSVFGYFKLDLISQLNQVAGTMVVNLRNNVNEMKITLFPPELGKVFVKFESTKDGQIVGNIVVSTREAFTLFEEHLSNIKEVLQNQGFQFVDINLSMNNGEFNEKESFDYVFGEDNIKVTSRKVEDNYNDAYLRYPDSSLEDSTISLYA